MVFSNVLYTVSVCTQTTQSFRLSISKSVVGNCNNSDLVIDSKLDFKNQAFSKRFNDVSIPPE